jgi:hypothetical protein
MQVELLTRVAFHGDRVEGSQNVLKSRSDELRGCTKRVTVLTQEAFVLADVQFLFLGLCKLALVEEIEHHLSAFHLIVQSAVCHR